MKDVNVAPNKYADDIIDDFKPKTACIMPLAETKTAAGVFQI